MPHVNKWSPEEISALKKLWADGASASEIARALHTGRSRDSVLGKAHKLKLPPRPDQTGPIDIRPDTWTDERVDLLKTLWAQGLPASRIADQLGIAISRNSVISKIHRLGLAKRSVSSARGVRNVKPKRPRGNKHGGLAFKIVEARKQGLTGADALEAVFGHAPVAPLITREEAWQALPGAEPVRMMDLEQQQCRWPIGEGRPYLFCGLHADGSYCPTHAAMSAPARAA